MNTLFTTNTMLWAAQISLACLLLYAGACKVFLHTRPAVPGTSLPLFGCYGLPHWLAAAMALLEIAGAFCLVMPVQLWPHYLMVRFVAAVLAIVMAANAFHLARSKQHSEPAIGAFLLAIFVLVGRWP